MKRLILFRHAKSDWDADYDEDHERPLNARGRTAADTMGRFLAAAGQVPERIVCSTAVRARTTVERASAAGGWSVPVELTPELYEASLDGVLALIRCQEDAVESVLLAGHEPTWSALAGELIGGARIKMPTAGMIHLEADLSRWRDWDYGVARLLWFVTPKLVGRVSAG